MHDFSAVRKSFFINPLNDDADHLSRCNRIWLIFIQKLFSFYSKWFCVYQQPPLVYEVYPMSNLLWQIIWLGNGIKDILLCNKWLFLCASGHISSCCNFRQLFVQTIDKTRFCSKRKCNFISLLNLYENEIIWPLTGKKRQPTQLYIKKYSDGYHNCFFRNCINDCEAKTLQIWLNTATDIGPLLCVCVCCE